MNRKRIIVMVALAAAVLLAVGGGLLSPLRWSQDHIQSWVLRKAPLGSTVAEVQALIKHQGWTLNYEWRGPIAPAAPKDYPYVRGAHIIGAYFGPYQGLPWRADVDAFWGFDGTGALIDFHVRKDYDTL